MHARQLRGEEEGGALARGPRHGDHLQGHPQPPQAGGEPPPPRPSSAAVAGDDDDDAAAARRRAGRPRARRRRRQYRLAPDRRRGVAQRRRGWRRGLVDATSSPSVPGELCESTASMQVHEGAAAAQLGESPEGVDVTSAVSDEVDRDDKATHVLPLAAAAADGESDELERKRRSHTHQYHCPLCSFHGIAREIV